MADTAARLTDDVPARTDPPVGPEFSVRNAQLIAAVLAVLLAMAVPLDTPPQWAAVRDAVPLLVAVMAFWYVPITWMIIWAAARLDPGRVSILLLIEVGVAALSASLMTDEPFGWREAVGGTLIMAAGALEAYDGMRRHSRRIA